VPAHVYADALARIDSMHGVVKLEFVSFVPGTGASDDTYEAEPCLRVVMNPRALATLHAQMLELLAELERAGLVERRDDGPPAADPARVAGGDAPGPA
jgi:hypothetical protein